MNLARNKTFNERLININFVCMKSIKKKQLLRVNMLNVTNCVCFFKLRKG